MLFEAATIGNLCGGGRRRPPASGDDDQQPPATGQALHVHSAEEYDRWLRNAGDRLVVVDFYADWCQPCRGIAPEVDSAAKRYPDVLFLKVNVEDIDELATRHRIDALPTFYFVRHNEVITGFEGANVQKLHTFVNKYK